MLQPMRAPSPPICVAAGCPSDYRSPDTLYHGGDKMSPITTLLLLTSTAGAPHHAVAVAPIRQDTLTVKEAEPGLKAKAKVPSDSAMPPAPSSRSSR